MRQSYKAGGNERDWRIFTARRSEEQGTCREEQGAERGTSTFSRRLEVTRPTRCTRRTPTINPTQSILRDQSDEPTHTVQNNREDERGLRIALIGATGAMGREVERLADQYGGRISHRFDSSNPLPEAPPHDRPDVAIDFTHPDVVIPTIERVVGWGVPIVVGTTGWLDEMERVEAIVGGKAGARVLWGSNFSVGVQVFFRIVHDAALLLDSIEAYDVALHEEHHVRKADAPSGTARTLAAILLESIERKTHIVDDTTRGRIAPDALHVTSSRIGATVGTHTVTFDSEADTITLTHRARSRSGFAIGALMAAGWIGRAEPGLYRFDDLFETIVRSAIREHLVDMKERQRFVGTNNLIEGDSTDTDLSGTTGDDIDTPDMTNTTDEGEME